MVLVVPATNRREICFVCTNSARSTTFWRRVGSQLAYVSRSTSRHFPILLYLATKFTKLGGHVGWQGFQEVPRGWGGNEGIRIGQGIRFQPFSAYLGPWGVHSAPFSYFGGVPLGPHYFPYYIPIPPVWLCCAAYLFLSPCVGNGTYVHGPWAHCRWSEDPKNELIFYGWAF